MRIACPSCSAAYNVDERRIPAAGLNVRCPKCQSAFPVRPPPPPPAEPVPIRTPTSPAPMAAAGEEPPGGSTAAFGSPFASPPQPFPPGEGAGGMTARFPPPFAHAAEEPAPSPLPVPAEGLGGSTMRFDAPFGEEAPAGAPFSGSVALPQPAGAAAPDAPPMAATGPPLGFGEVELPGPAADAPFAEEPLPVAPDPPPPPDPFASAPPPPASPGDPFGSAIPAPPPPGPDPEFPVPPPEVGPGALGRRETEELEALFQDAGGAPTPAVKRPKTGPEWRIRRRSGKVFGPFPEGEVVRMLTRGELLGNEEISSDEGEGARWRAIGEEAVFGEAIRKLIERPAGEGAGLPSAAPFGEPAVVPKAKPPRGPSLGDRLAILRERAVSLLDRLPGWARYAVLGGGAAVVLGLGLGVGLTDYGIFFHRLIRGQVGPNRPGARLCGEARARFAEDTWPAAQAALGLARQAVLLSSVDREAKGLQAQIASWMARRTGVDRSALAQARASVAEIAQQAPHAADTIKARVSMALVSGSAPGPDAVPELERWIARAPRDEDAIYLLGEWALARGETGRAEGLFGRLDQLRPEARSAHALGLAAQARGDDKAAAGHFAEALKRDPRHLSSALELAALSLRAGDLPAAAARLERLLAPEPRELLGPRERARTRQLRGEMLARQLGDEPEKRLAEVEKELEAAVQEDPDHLPARIAWGRFLLRRNAPARALQALEPAVAAGGPEVADLQARALAGSGRVLDAMNALDAAAARSGKSPRLVFARGLVLEAGGKRAEAEQLYAEAARDPGLWEPHLALGRSRLRAGNLDGAAPEILLAVEKAPGEADAQAGLAELRLAKGDAGGAEEAWRKALAIDPGHAPSHLGLARVALARNDRSGATASLERAARLDPRLGEARLLLGGLRWKAGDLPGAAAEFRAVADLDPRNAVALTRLGAVELERGRVDAAYDELLKASNVEVALAENRFWLGRALLVKGDAAQAAEQLARAVDLDRRDAQHHLWLGIALERASKAGEAGDAYREALQVDPRLAEAAERLGLVLAGLSRCGEAVPWFERAIQLAPREQRLRMELADCRMKLGQAPQAIQVYRDALKADPKLVALYYRIARAVHESSGAIQAVPWYEKAAQLDRDNPMPHYYLGFAYKVRGKRSRAVEEFRSYLRLKPDADDRKDIEREIEDLGG